MTNNELLVFQIGCFILIACIFFDLFFISDRLEKITRRQNRMKRKIDSFKELYKDNQVDLNCFFDVKTEGKDNEKKG